MEAASLSKLRVLPQVGITTYWGAVVEPEKLTVRDIHSNKRTRIQAKQGPGTDSWFRYDQSDFDTCINRVLKALPSAETWVNQNLR